MDKSKVIYVSGYRSFELGVFKENDPKIQVVKNVLKKELHQLAEEGLEWVLVSGNLGVELWAVQIVAELKEEYPELSLGILYPFSDFGNNWNEGNQEKKQLAEQLADYVEAVSHQPYQSPSQLKNHTRFILEHTVGCLLIYDEE
ncbi:TPA: SLOG family protein, partial [Enterococcus faecium]